MELDKILHLVPAHIEQIIVVLTALFFVTTILLLVRSLKEKPQVGSELDVSTIEGALKRVLSQAPAGPAASAAPVTDADSASGITINTADTAPLKAALLEKEKQLSTLQRELADAKASAQAAAAAPGSMGAAPASVGPNAAALAALEKEINDLKSRLSEYEIIEDDIADLALYKEENARLKKEIEEARAGGTGRIVVTPAQEANAAAGIPGLAEALAAETAPAPSPANDPSEDDLEKQVAEALAANKARETAVAAQTFEGADLMEAPVTPAVAPAVPTAAAPPTSSAVPPSMTPDTSAAADLLGDLDTEKMLKEAESLAAAPQGEEPEINALSDLLDTDKLLEEVNSLDAQDVMSEFKDKSKNG